MDLASEIIIPSIVVHEYMWVMLRLGVNPLFVADKVGEYLNDPRTLYVCEPPSVIMKALMLLEEHRASMRELDDYIILVTAVSYRATLATFDKKLARVATSLGVEVLPRTEDS